MTTQEEKIRTAIRETAAEIPPDHSPPLRLPLRPRRTLGTLRPRRTLGTLRRRGPQRWPGWVAPLAAAVTVTVVIAGTFALTREFARTHVSAHHGTGPVGGWTGPVTGGAGPPAYYVYLRPVRPGTAGGPLPEATITSTLTGKPVATVASPRPYVGFDYVAAAGNSSTFVLAAQQQNQIRRAGRSQGVVAVPEKFFLLHVSPTGHTRLTPLGLPVRVDPGFLAGIALSPDGSRLALASEGKPPWTHGSVLQVFNLANGTSRRWAWPNTGSEWVWASDLANLAWMNEQTLAFQMPVGARPAHSPELGPGAVLQTRMLDTAAPGRNLAASRRVPGRTSLGGGDTGMTVAPGAGLIMEFDRARKAPAHRGIDEVSMATGETVRTLGGGKAIEAFWSNATGTKLIVLEENAAGKRELGIVTARGAFTPLPAPRAVTVDWQYLFIAW
jgi:hypothetical protein